ncbi:NrsF family protein [Kosakonia sp. H02]|nr:NrsF family protein [Kosakonia sp. H02]
MADHELLIEKLSRSVEPVKRPWQPGWRVVSWLAVALPCGIVASLWLNRALTDWSQSGAPWVMAQLLLTFATGTLAIRNAFLLSIAGRRPLGWRWFMPLVSVWLASTLVNLHLHHTFAAGGVEGPNCYLFMLVVSVPMAAIVVGYLRRTRTLFPARSLGAAGAGVACMALTLLSLCHPTHISVADLLGHLAAIGTIVLLTIVLGYRWVSLP